MKYKVKMPAISAIRDVAGAGDAALVLQRLVYWHHKATIERRGHRWVIKTLPEWGEECGISVRQVRRALTILRGRRAIVTEQHILGMSNPNFMRLTREAVRHLGIPPAGWSAQDDRKWSPSRVAGIGHPRWTGTGQPLMQGVSAGSLQGVSTSEAPQTALEDEDQMGKSTQELVADLLATKGKATQEFLEILLGAEMFSRADLQRIWRVSRLITNPDEFQKAWTQKEYGHVTYLENNLPVGGLARFLAEVAGNWEEFGMVVKKSTGFATIGEYPSLSAVVQHLTIAVEWIKERAQTSAPKMKTLGDF